MPASVSRSELTSDGHTKTPADGLVSAGATADSGQNGARRLPFGKLQTNHAWKARKADETSQRIEPAATAARYLSIVYGDLTIWNGPW